MFEFEVTYHFHDENFCYCTVYKRLNGRLEAHGNLTIERSNNKVRHGLQELKEQDHKKIEELALSSFSKSFPSE